MKKVLSITVVALVIIVGGFFALNSYIYHEEQGGGFPDDFKEVTFYISGEPVTLVDGVAQAPAAPDSASMTTVRYFGNELTHDIDGDGTDDVVFLVTQETGGSGTFFFLVGALKRDSGYEGTHAVYIGDRIAPQTTNAGDGRQVIVNYADRAPGEPFSAKPTVGKSLYLLLDPKTLEFGEVVQDFEGEDNWMTATSNVGQFKYPADFTTSYIYPVDWPPSVQVLSEPFSCTEVGKPNDRAGETAQRTIGGRVYCVTTKVEGAAGSIYTQYAYAFAKNEKIVVLTFSTREPQCANYDEPEKSTCETERTAFDVDTIVDGIARTLVLGE